MTLTRSDFERVVRNGNLNTHYSADDFVNPAAFESHPRNWNQKAFVVLNGGFVQAIVFAEYYAYSEQDVLDQAADSGKLEGLQCDETELADYKVGEDSDGYPEYEGIINLGNASEPFASESLDIWILPASYFAEDPALMSFDRVQTYLEDARDKADTAHKATDVHAEEWSARYRELS